MKRERHNQNVKVGYNGVSLKNQKLKKKRERGDGTGQREKDEQTQGALFQSRHKNVSVSKSLSCKNSRAFEEEKNNKKSNKLKRGSQTSYIYLYI